MKKLIIIILLLTNIISLLYGIIQQKEAKNLSIEVKDQQRRIEILQTNLTKTELKLDSVHSTFAKNFNSN